MITYSALLLPELAFFLGLKVSRVVRGWIYDTNPCHSEINSLFKFPLQRDVM